MILMNRNRMDLSEIAVRARAAAAAAARSIDFSSLKRNSHEIYQLSAVIHRVQYGTDYDANAINHIHKHAVHTHAIALSYSRNRTKMREKE